MIFKKKPKTIELLCSVLKIVTVAYVGIFLLVYFRQSKYVYYPNRTVDLTPASAGMEYEDLRLKTSDGETIAGWYVPTSTNRERAPVLIDCHGNAGDIGDRVVVTSVPDEKKGEQLVVFYTDEAGTPERLHEIITKSDLPNLWKPKKDSYVRVDSMPTLGSGKMDLKRLKSMAEEFALGKETRPAT